MNILFILAQVQPGAEQLVEFLRGVVFGVGTAGVYTWIVSAFIIEYQQRRKGELSNEAKRDISIVLPIFTMIAFYLAGVGLGGWELTFDTAFAALKALGAEIGLSKIIFGVARKAEDKIAANQAGSLYEGPQSTANATTAPATGTATRLQAIRCASGAGASGEDVNLNDGNEPTTLNGDGPCQDCGTPDNIIWFTDNVLWNTIMPDDGLLCIRCFVVRVEAAGYRPLSWRVLPHWEPTRA